MKIRGLIFLGLIFTSGLINAQTNFRPGYVIKTIGDTLIGEIDYRGDYLMGEVCRFKLKDTDEEFKYSPDDIISYRFDESKYFVSKELNMKRVFMEFLIKGKINIYYLRDHDGDHYFLEKEGIGINEIPYEEGIKYKGTARYFYQSNKYKGILNYYMQDASEFQSRIAKLGKPDHFSLVKLAEDYHNKICKDESCIIYEKKIPPIKLSFEPLIGFEKFNQPYSNIGSVYEFGANLFIQLTRDNENLYFKTGIFYAFNDSIHLYKVPLQFQYLFPSKQFRPKVNIGFNIYKLGTEMLATPHIGIGFISKLYKSVNFSATINSDFAPLFPVLVGDAKLGVFSYSFEAGLYIEL